jgi:V/A-type H+-transporting ATPase subunit D
MLANEEIDVSGLVELGEAELGEENVVGVKLPVLKKMECKIREYSMLAKPQWVDVLVELLKKMAELRAQVQVAEERVRRMEQALRRITQRVNLFEKILIPENKKTIQRIQIFLGDADRAAVVRSKIAKSRHVRQPEEMADEGVTP